MGQKTHPLGFRLGVTQTARSQWFANFKEYPTLIEEDTKIRNFLEKESAKIGISKIQIIRPTANKIEVEIHSARPGTIVGAEGNNLKSIHKDLEKLLPKNRIILIKIIETEHPDTHAALIGDYIVEQLETRVAFRRAIRKAIKRTQTANVAGIKVQVSGRLNGAEIARSEWIREGRVPLQTLRADIDYVHKEAHTIYGVLGVKVWLFKGEII